MSPTWKPWLAALCVLQPVLSAAFRADGSHRWAQDVDAIRALSLSQVGAEGIVSSAVSAAFTLLPFGSRLFRAQLPNLALLCLASLLIYSLALTVLSSRAPRFRHGALAAAAALAATASPGWQLESTSVGGGCMAAVLVLVLAAQLQKSLPEAWISHGVLLGLLVVESRPGFACGVALLLADSATRVRLPRIGALLLGALVAVATAAVCLLPSLVGGLNATGLGRMGLSLALPLGAEGVEPTALQDLGLYFVGLSAIGLLISALRPRLRRVLFPWASVGVVYWLLPDAVPALLVACAVAVFASLGLLSLADAARVSRLPLRSQTFRLAALFHLGALLVLMEGARGAHLARAVSGTAEWSEQAFSRLPASSLLITHSPDAAWRLWAARLSGGTRPDVLLVPQALLAHGDVARELLAHEPALGRVVRDLALEGQVGEYALSALADARPVRTELDPRWDRRILAHCVPDGLWFRFVPHEMGRSDRAAGLRSTTAALKAVRRASTRDAVQDQHTLARLKRDAREQLVVSTALRDRANATRLLRRLKRMQLDPHDSSRFRAAIKNPRSLASVQDLLP